MRTQYLRKGMGNIVKKFLTRLTAIILAVMIAVPMFTIKAEAAVGPGQAGTVGIDVSKYQGAVDWNAVKASGVTFAFIKCFSSAGGIDPYFAANIQGANAVGIRTGVYVYSYATSVEGAIAEANTMISILQNFSITYPVAYDIEDRVQKNLPNETLTAMANAFCATIEAAGYYPIVYSSKSWFNTKLAGVTYDRWVAQWGSVCDAAVAPAFWQASCTARIGGVAGQVDLDYQYKDYSFIKPVGFSPVGDRMFFYNNYRKMRGWVDYNGLRYYAAPSDGSLYRGWMDCGNGVVYYFGEDYAMATGFRNVGEATFYFGADGLRRTGAQIIAEQNYLFDGNGVMYRGWYRPGDFVYKYSDIDGHMIKGWYQEGDGTFFFDAEGHMYTGLRQVGDAKYYFDEIGKMQIGWVPTAAGTMYMDATGKMQTGFIALADGTYYVDPTTGFMRTGLVDIAGQKYFFNPENGKMMTGIVTVGAANFYFKPDTGVMTTGLITVGDATYYFDPASGAMVVGAATMADGIRYFDATGKMQTGWVTIGESMFYFTPGTGVMYTGLLQDAQGYKYLAPSDGHLCVGIVSVDGVPYYFDPATGYLTPNATITIGASVFQSDANGVVVQIQ